MQRTLTHGRNQDCLIKQKRHSVMQIRFSQQQKERKVFKNHETAFYQIHTVYDIFVCCSKERKRLLTQLLFYIIRLHEVK